MPRAASAARAAAHKTAKRRFRFWGDSGMINGAIVGIRARGGQGPAVPLGREKMLGRLVRNLALGMAALAGCMGSAGCATVNIDANNLHIPGLSARRVAADGDRLALAAAAPAAQSPTGAQRH